VQNHAYGGPQTIGRPHQSVIVTDGIYSFPLHSGCGQLQDNSTLPALSWQTWLQNFLPSLQTQLQPS